MAASEPTFPGAFPATPGECSGKPDPLIEMAKSYVLDLSERSRPYLPEAVAKHLPEKSESEIKSEPISGPSDENIYSEAGERSSFSGDDRGQRPEKEEQKRNINPSQDLLSTTSPENQDEDNGGYESDEIIPVDPSAYGPKDNVGCEQEREELFMEETAPSIVISKSGSENIVPRSIDYCPATHNDVERETSESSAGAQPVSTGVAEDQLLADYLVPHEPTARVGNGGNQKDVSTSADFATSDRFEPRARDFAVEEEIARMSINSDESDTVVEGESSTTATVVIDSINDPYKPHRLENIQEKTRDNRLPPLPPSDATGTADPESESRFSKLRWRRRRSSAASKDDMSERRRSTSDPTDQPLEGIQESRDHGSVGNSERAKKEDAASPDDFPQPQKVGLLAKIKGEIKVVTGELQGNKEKVEEGKRMMGRK